MHLTPFLRSGTPLWHRCQQYVAMTATVLLATLVSRSVCGQSDTRPGLEYAVAQTEYLQGDYLSALRSFQHEARRGATHVQGPWLDGICYHAMIGECLYQTGDLPAALAAYNRALQIFVARRGWMQQLQLPGLVGPSQRTRRGTMTWGVAARSAVVGSFPDKFLIQVGPAQPIISGQSGGVIGAPQFLSLRVDEIMRCTCLALRRRHDILGFLTPRDPLSATMVDVLRGEQIPAVHWLSTWRQTALGIAMVGAGDARGGAAVLEAAVAAMGTLDHPVTATALVELGKLYAAQGEFELARQSFREATFAGGEFDQGQEMEEGFIGAMNSAYALGAPVAPAPLIAAATWARNHDLTRLQTALLISAAEASSLMGNTGPAAQLLTQATASMRRTTLPASNLGSYHQYVAALIRYQSADLVQGNQALARAIAFQIRSSPYLLRLNLVNQSFESGAESARNAARLYSALLADPSGSDWSYDPITSLTRTLADLRVPFANWFAAAWEYGSFTESVEISDRIRANRFHSQIALGARLVSLRWILTRPEKALSQTRKEMRHGFVQRHPGWIDHLQQWDAMYAQWARPPEEVDAGSVRTLLQRSQKLAAEQQWMLRAAALSREPSATTFPRHRSLRETRKRLQPNQAVLVFTEVHGQLYGMLITDNPSDDTPWKIANRQQLKGHITTLLRELGHYSAKHKLKVDQLTRDEWTDVAAAVWRLLITDRVDAILQSKEELIIVPDQFLWYVPYAVLPVDGKKRLLGDRWQWRVVPMTGLLQADAPIGPDRNNLAIALGKMSPVDKMKPEEVEAEYSVTDMRRIMLGIPFKPVDVWNARSSYALGVLADLASTQRSNQSFPAAVLAGSRAETPLDSWLAFPWAAPEVMAFPGFHTAAEHGIGRDADGTEVFQLVMGAMAAGTRTVLLSQWVTGGQAARDLTREFLLEMKRRPATDAWQRAVQLMRATPATLDAEPRITSSPADDTPNADHPFFWGGFLLADRGLPPDESAGIEDENDDDQAHEKEVVVGAIEPAATRTTDQPEAEPRNSTKPDRPDSDDDRGDRDSGSAS